MALMFDYFVQVAPAVIKNLGLVIFPGAVGAIADMVFFKNFKKDALQYVLLGIVTILIGAACCVAAIKLFNIPTALSVRILNDTLTSTPGLATALDAMSDHMTSLGYGNVYPFGVVGVVFCAAYTQHTRH